MANRKGTRSGFGSIRKLPSGRFQARYTGPDEAMHKAPFTFDTKKDAEGWLAKVRASILNETWMPAGAAGSKLLTFGAWSEEWLRNRTLAERTRADYRALLDGHILPTFEKVPLKYVTAEAVDEWYGQTAVEHPTTRAHAYGLLRTILGTAVNRRHITYNPCHIRGAGNAKRVARIEPATLPELEALVGAMPDRYRLMVLLAAWCALRFGELTELRRSDVDTKRGVLKVRRGVVRVDGKTIVKPPKSGAGIRDVNIPPHLMPMVREHLLKYAEADPGADRKGGLLFPARSGGHLAPSSLYRVFYRARKAAGRPDLRFHDLRHTGAVLAAATGATLAELMARLGHSTQGAAMRYQHAAKGRDKEIARLLSAMVEQGGVVSS